MDETIEFILGDLLLFILNLNHQFSWKRIDSHKAISSELGNVIIDSSEKNLIRISHISENWSIIRKTNNLNKKLPNSVITVIFENKKIKRIENKVIYQYEGSLDDINIWLMEMKLKLA